MSHLGSAASALVDGRLAPAATERALAHAAACTRCAQDLATARAVRRSLAQAQDVAPDSALTDRLLALGATAPVAEPGRPAPERWDRAASDHALTPRWVVPDGRRTRRRRALAGLAVAGGGSLVVLAVVGAGSPVEVPTNRMVAIDALAVSTTTEGSDASPVVGDGAVSAWMDDHGWSGPAALPPQVEVLAVREPTSGTPYLEVDLEVGGGTVVVRERKGVLDEDSLGGSPHADVDGVDVVVLADEPRHLVWQAGGAVVELIAPTGADDASVGAVVAAFPARDYDAGVPARIVRGWSTMTGALDIP